MIEVSQLTKSFGPRTALAGVNLRVAPGECVVLCGPNGAGKTTLLRILATLARPTSGTVRIAGLDPLKAGAEVRQHIGFVSHRTLLYDDLTAEQNLAFYARMYGIPAAQTRIDELLEQVGLTARRHDLVRTFSRGMQQRLAVARAVLHRPALVLLDEPYTGLDPLAADTLTALLTDLTGAGCTLLLTSHNLQSDVTLNRRVVVLNRGRLVYDAPHTDASTFPALYRELVQEARGKKQESVSVESANEESANGRVSEAANSELRPTPHSPTPSLLPPHSPTSSPTSGPLSPKTWPPSCTRARFSARCSSLRCWRCSSSASRWICGGRWPRLPRRACSGRRLRLRGRLD